MFFIKILFLFKIIISIITIELNKSATVRNKLEIREKIHYVLR